MTKLYISMILVLSVCATTFAQADKILPCPTLDVTGPARTVEPDTPITFTASLSKEAEKFNLEYKWTVSNGEIIEGQKTLNVKVLIKDVEKAITASLEILGLPKECASTGSASVITCFPPKFINIDEFSVSVSQIEEAKLSDLIFELKNTPNAIAYIIEKFEKKTSRQAITQKNKLIAGYLKNNEIGKERFVLMNAFADENLTQFFIGASGVNSLICSDCITVESK